MKGKNHIKIALSLTVFTLNLPLIASAVVGSILPDIDSSTSIICSVIPFSGRTFGRLRHRGITHSLVALSLTTIASYLIFKSFSVSLGFFVGYLSHILSDMMTVKGVELMWPNRKLYRIGLNIRTGSKLEYVTVSIIILMASVATFKLWNWF